MKPNNEETKRKVGSSGGLDLGVATFWLALILVVLNLSILFMQFVNSKPIRSQEKRIESLSSQLSELREEQTWKAKQTEEPTKKLE